jgi:inosose dehydratase
MIGMGAYPWMQLLGGGADFPPKEPEAMARTAAAGLTLWEGFLPETAEHADALRGTATATGLVCRSSYVNARLHEDDWSARADDVVRCAERLLPLGLEVLVVNPEPINWREPLDKDDAQLRTQARAVQALGERLRGVGVRLAYHTHSPEMRQAAREFHHTLRATDPAFVRLCLDAHWVYRGAGNSHVALEDIVGMYAGRVVSVHLRQSQGGVWSEAFTERGDIDYPALFATLWAAGFVDGPVVLEQAREAGTPSTIEFDEALRHSYDAATRLLSS